MLNGNIDVYDPRIAALIDQCDLDWGDPVANRARLVPYGIGPIDTALYGLDPEGELIIIQGEQKKRKTTLAVNVLINIYMGIKPLVKPFINVDVLESGMPPKKYRDSIIANVASRWMIQQGHAAGGYCAHCDGACKELRLSPKFLRYNRRSRIQMDAIEYAKATVSQWPLLLHGPRLDQGNTRNLKAALYGDKKEPGRWKRLIEDFGVSIFVSDHLQQYAFPGKSLSDYEKQNEVIPPLSDFVAQNSVALLLISQVSRNSLQEARETGGKLTAAGGARAAQEANTVFSVGYDGENIMTIKIEESRDAANLVVWQKLDSSSGAFYGEATLQD